jgi:LAS superfamily LD-carboxypeptidase LdcB
VDSGLKGNHRLSFCPMIPANLVGKDESHLCSAADAEWLGTAIHQDVVEPFRQLRAAAAESGFDVAILSGFRSFETQLSIWNRKARGELAVLDSNVVPLDIKQLTDQELMFAILRWSALPGASRHHWGTDIDVYDANARPVGYEIELIPTEYDAEGMFSPFSVWLDERIATGTSVGFFRPYDLDRNGVAPERWHISYAPLSTQYQKSLNPQLLRTTIESADILLKDVVLANLDEIVDRFVVNTNPDFP